MERLGIIGGTFDPIHLAHVYIAEVAKAALNLDRVIFMVAGSPPHKTNKQISDADVRYKMTEFAIMNKEGLEVSDYEIKEQGLSYTYKTLEHLNNSNRELYFITGGDCLMNIESWRNVPEILSLCQFVVVTRPGVDNDKLIKQRDYISSKYNSNIVFLEVDGINISSTEIREKISKGEDVSKYLNTEVQKIIADNNLYKGE